MNVNRLVPVIVWLITWVPVTAQHSENIQNGTLKQVTDLVERATKLIPSYQGDAVTGWKPFTFSVKNVSTPLLLFHACKGQPFSYRIIHQCFTFVPRNPVDDTLAQPVSYNGFVTDSENNPIPRAAIYLLRSGAVHYTRPNGEFYFEALAGDPVRITNLYFDTLYTVLSPDVLNNLVMRRQVQSLHDVVHTGFKQLTATGSYRKADRDLLRMHRSADALNNLELLGLLRTKNHVPGTNQTMYYQLDSRTTLFNAPDMPVIVDGFPYTGDLRNLNPALIKSITVLRDGPAVNLNGSGAGNGVLVIELIKPVDDGLRIHVDYALFAGRKPDVFARPQMSSGQLVEAEQAFYRQGIYDNFLGSPVYSNLSRVVETMHAITGNTTDTIKAWRDLENMKNQDLRKDIDRFLLRNSFAQQVALNIAQKKGSRSYLMSGSIYKASPFFTGSSEQRKTFSLFGEWSISKKFTVAGRIEHADYFTKNTDGFQLHLRKYEMMADADGHPLSQQFLYRPFYVNKHKTGPLYSFEYFPLLEARFTNNTTTHVNKRYWFDITYRINNCWQLQGRYQWQNSKAGALRNESLYSFNTRNILNDYTEIVNGVPKYHIPPGDILRGGNWWQSANNIRLQAQYRKTAGNGIHTEIVVGGDLRTVKEQKTSLLLYGVQDGNPYDQSSINFSDSFRLFTSGVRRPVQAPAAPLHITSTTISLYGEGELSYQHRFFVSGSIRHDRSSIKNIGITIKPGVYYSAGGGWNVHNETFYRLTWLTLLKLRASYGRFGNGNTQQGEIAAVNPRFTNPFRTPQAGAGKNVSFRWEQVTMWNGGIDFELNTTFKGSIDAYRKTGSDLLTHVPTGVAGEFTMANAAKIEGWGINASIHTSWKWQHWSWKVGWLLNYSRNTVRDYIDLPMPAWDRTAIQFLSIANNEPFNTLKSFQVSGLDTLGLPMVWKNGDAHMTETQIATDSTMKYLVSSGSSVPRFFGSLYTACTWKRFSLWLEIVYKLDYYFRRASIDYPALAFDNYYGHTDFNDRWQKKGDEYRTTIPALHPAMTGDLGKIYNQSNLLMEKADNLRVQNIYASVDLSGLRPFSAWFRTASFFISVENPGIVFTATGDKTDPDYLFEYAPRVSCTVGFRCDL